MFTSLKRFFAPALLNLLGLTIAYIAFIIIAMQVVFEYTYESYNKNRDNVFQVILDNPTGQKAYWAQPIVDELATVSPKIETSSIYDELPWNQNIYISVFKPSGAEEMFQISKSCTYAGLPKIIDMQILEGDPAALSHPHNYLIPKSIADKIWHKESAVGKRFFIGKKEYTIGAVYKDLPKNSVFGNYWYYTATPEQKTGLEQANYSFLLMLDNAKSSKEVAKLLSEKIKKVYANHQEYNSPDKIPPISLRPIKEAYFAPSATLFLQQGDKNSSRTLAAIAILILTIAFINNINFAMAMAPVRIKVLNLQKIMGCSKNRLIFNLLTESIIISLTAYLLALLVIVTLQSTELQGRLIAGISITNHLPVIFAGGIIAIIAGVTAGIWPALFMTAPSPALVLQGTPSSSPKGRLFRHILIGFQFIISTALIIATMFINLQNRYISEFPMGFNTQNIWITKIAKKVFEVQNTLVEQLKQSPIIEDVAFASYPLGATEQYEHWGASFGEDNVEFNLMNVTPNFLRMLGIEVTSGRDFREEDHLLEQSSVIFNHLTPKINGNPTTIGEGIKESEITYFNFEVIGFIGTGLRTLSMRVPEAPFAFFVAGTNQNGKAMALPYMYIKTVNGIDPQTARDSIHSICTKVVPIYPFHPEPMDYTVAALYVKERNTNYLITLFAFLTIVISLTGIFGLVLFETKFRRKETALRRVHGASIASILAMYNKKYLTIVAICFIIATPISFYAIKIWLSGFAYRIPLYWWVFATGLFIVVLLTATTVTLRSWKSSMENPAKVLKG